MCDPIAIAINLLVSLKKGVSGVHTWIALIRTESIHWSDGDITPAPLWCGICGKDGSNKNTVATPLRCASISFPTVQNIYIIILSITCLEDNAYQSSSYGMKQIIRLPVPDALTGNNCIYPLRKNLSSSDEKFVDIQIGLSNAIEPNKLSAKSNHFNIRIAVFFISNNSNLKKRSLNSFELTNERLFAVSWLCRYAYFPMFGILSSISICNSWIDCSIKIAVSSIARHLTPCISSVVFVIVLRCGRRFQKENCDK